MELPKRISTAREYATFCLGCGRSVDSGEGPSQETQISQPQDVPCTIVLSLGAGEIERASTGVRIFYQDPAYWRGCICPDGKNCGDYTEQERERLIHNISSQLKQGAPTFLCRSIPYCVAEKVIRIFYDRANAFLFYDSDGSTIEELNTATPKIKYIIGDLPPLEVREEPGMWEKMGLPARWQPHSNPWQNNQQQSPNQQFIIIKQNIGGGCLGELLGLVLVLIIIVLIDSL